MLTKLHKSTKIGLVVIFLVTGFIVFSQTAVGQKLNLSNDIVQTVWNFIVPTDTDFKACDYKDGMILLVKPVATGVGEGRYEAGDIVEIRDPALICEKFGNVDPLGKEERTKFLPLYYSQKLTLQQIEDLTAPDGQIVEVQEPDELSPTGYTTVSVPEVNKRRKFGVDYTKFLNTGELKDASNLKNINRMPQIKFEDIKEKTKDEKAVVAIADFDGQEKTNWQNFVDFLRPTAYAVATEVIKTIKDTGGDYATLAAFEAGEQRDLVTADEIAVGEVYNDIDFSGSYVNFLGWVMDTDHRAVFRIPTTNGEYQTGYYHYGLENNGIKIDRSTVNSYLFVLRTGHYLTIKGFELTGSGITTSYPLYKEGTSGYRVEDCLMHGFGKGIGSREYTKNSIIYDFGPGYVQQGGIMINSTVYAEEGEGAYSGDIILSEVQLYNVAVYHNHTNVNYNSIYNCTGDYVATNKSVAPGTNSIKNLALADFDFVDGDGTSKDLHIGANSLLIGEGVGNSVNSAVPLYDIDLEAGNRAGATSDIGADEYVAGGEEPPAGGGASADKVLKGGVIFKNGVIIKE